MIIDYANIVNHSIWAVRCSSCNHTRAWHAEVCERNSGGAAIKYNDQNLCSYLCTCEYFHSFESMIEGLCDESTSR